MIPKFKIGDLVTYISGVGNKVSVIKIGQILIGPSYVQYRNSIAEVWTDEHVLSLYTEPKTKVKKYLYAYRVGNRPEGISGYFHENDSEFKNDLHGQITWSKRLDWSMIEVEE